MKKLVQIYTLSLFLIGVGLIQSCSPAKDNNPGSEYMPDMFHSIAYEANLDDYYFYNTWGDHKDYYKLAVPREPVKGSIPFGQFALKNGQYSEAMQSTVMDIEESGSVPSEYDHTEEGRLEAIASIRTNPFPITEEALVVGKNLYTIYCGLCHGDKADGMGFLVRDDGGKYPVAPANLLDAKFVDTTAGVFYYAIEYGKNAMGSYADKLSYKERWDVIHYIRSLQAKEAKLEYSPTKNTFMPNEAHTEKMAANQPLTITVVKGGHTEGHSEHGTH